MAGAQRSTGSSSTCNMQRWVGLCLLLILQPILMVSSSRPLQEDLHSRQGRVLTQSATHGNVLIDYIGASGDATIAFTDPPIAPGVNYIFLLAFAIDADANGNTANGVFSPYWSTSLTPASATSFTQANSNVQIGLSLGGATQYVSSSNPSRQVNWYDPASNADWISNAVSSITSLASQYSLTAIDIDYENFPVSGAASASFTTCIGSLITQLKNNGIITKASIAPFGQTLPQYEDLFTNYGSVIDYVSYQFYADDATSQSEFVTDFNTIQADFPSTPTKMMASVEANTNNGLQNSDFISAAQQVTIAGIMNFDVDASKGNSFELENLAETFLASS